MIPAARPEIGEDERIAVDRVLRSGMLAQGPEVAAFENEFASIVDGRQCIAVNSGTSALQLAFLAGGIGAGVQAPVHAQPVAKPYLFNVQVTLRQRPQECRPAIETQRPDCSASP